ncbi:hypothetical protein J1N35_041266 [Gossypium stocksii]|uniref:Retrotransposon gag domain-containing protein n=1 Tax=Gossypium stocksii TaxID=47602 RepID=A0A9D3ZJ81_9ROSI|nr:hypothetical protein J1N35_041266 [Gossypium stocksii]
MAPKNTITSKPAQANPTAGVEELGEQFNVQVVKYHQPPINEVVTTDQLKELIKEVIKDQVDCVTKPSYIYSKYSYRIDRLKMPANYQPLKFQQFDGKESPCQHVAHSMETCNNAGIKGDLMVKQFARSLKGNAFKWYNDLDIGTITVGNNSNVNFQQTVEK